MVSAAFHAQYNCQKMAARRRKEQLGNKKGAWTAEEDAKLSQYIEIHAASNPNKWKTIAARSGVNRSGKSCRLRWLNYLRPNIKRGNISDDEEDLIIRLHNLLGNRWSLIAGRIPGRTDNEIKNYWNSYLSKKILEQQHTKTKEEAPGPLPPPEETAISSRAEEEDEGENYYEQLGGAIFDDDDINFDDIFDFSNNINGSSGLDWVDNFLQDHQDVQLSTKDIDDPAP